MFLISRALRLAARWGGPRLAFQIRLRQLRRWKNVEPEWLILDRLVDRQRAAVDVGANEGLYSGRLAQLCPRVHAFEPIPWLADGLETRLPRQRVRIHRLALSDRQGQAELRIPYAGSGEELNGLSTLEAGAGFASGMTLRSVPCALRRLDDVVAEPVGFIKIDVEGHELPVLQGATRMLTHDRPVLLVESQRSTHRDAPANIFAFLETLGYVGCFYENRQRQDLSAFDPDRHQTEGTAMAGGTFVNNFIFLPAAAALTALPRTIPN